MELIMTPITVLPDLTSNYLLSASLHNGTMEQNMKEDIVEFFGGLLWGTASALWRMLSDDSEIEEEVRKAALEEQEKEFHSFVRQQIVCLLLFLTLYLTSYWIISRFKAKSDTDALYAGEEDYFVYRISVWICTFSLAVSISSVTLLPFSVLGAELIQSYPGNYYLQWLTWDLIHSLWNYVFIFANLCLFVLLPFCYFFIESHGFNKLHNGLLQRMYEALAVCALLIVVLLCFADVVLALIGSSLSLLSITSVNLPLIYSCVSLCGVVLLLVSTPIGFARMFNVVGRRPVVDEPDEAEDSMVEKLEKNYLNRKWNTTNRRPEIPSGGKYCVIRRTNGFPAIGTEDETYFHHEDVFTSDPAAGDCIPQWATTRKRKDKNKNIFVTSYYETETKMVSLREKALQCYEQVMLKLKYPVTVLALVAATGIAVLMVVINTLKLLFGFRSLPEYAQFMEVQSRHTFGIVGVIVEIVIILYVMATSLVGVYSVPFIRSHRPERKNTSMTSIIMNCSLVLVLSSALPVLANTIGLTTFEMLGVYSSLEWLSNFRLVLAYNVLFTIVSVLSIFNQITTPVRNEIWKRLAALKCPT